MRDWQHQQQQDEQERLEEIERLLDQAEDAMMDSERSPRYVDEWRDRIDAAIGLSKTPKPDKVEKF